MQATPSVAPIFAPLHSKTKKSCSHLNSHSRHTAQRTSRAHPLAPPHRHGEQHLCARRRRWSGRGRCWWAEDSGVSCLLAAEAGSSNSSWIRWHQSSPCICFFIPTKSLHRDAQNTNAQIWQIQKCNFFRRRRNVWKRQDICTASHKLQSWPIF